MYPHTTPDTETKLGEIHILEIETKRNRLQILPKARQ